MREGRLETKINLFIVQYNNQLIILEEQDLGLGFFKDKSIRKKNINFELNKSLR